MELNTLSSHIYTEISNFKEIPPPPSVFSKAVSKRAVLYGRVNHEILPDTFFKTFSSTGLLYRQIKIKETLGIRFPV